MNVIAGVVMGWVNDSWSARLIAPFIWGVVWCVRFWITSAHRTFKLNEGSAGEAWGLNSTSAFYVIEYGTSVTTSLLFSVLVGAIRAILY